MDWPMTEISGSKNTLEWVLNLLSPLQGLMKTNTPPFVGLRFSLPYANSSSPFRAFKFDEDLNLATNNEKLPISELSPYLRHRFFHEAEKQLNTCWYMA